MALDLKLTFDGADSSGRVINVHDSTGLYTPDNLGGWGSPNPDPSTVTMVRVTLSPIFTQETYKQDFLPTEWNVQDIVEGMPLSLSSLSLGTTTTYEPLEAFNDGVYDINYYAVMPSVSGVSAVKGTSFITGPNMDTYFNYDSVKIGDHIYGIDHTQAPYGNTTLNLTDEILDDATTFNPVYRSNVKAMVESMSNCLLMANAGKVASSCGCGDDRYLEAGLRAIMMKTAADISFKSWNYAQADAMLRGAVATLKKTFGGCGC